tara:strand:- start:365 stop:583 length:219 start_codon:yes stop_codon:yes gene_type:complete
MRIGELIRYAPFPHKELHESGMTGLIISEPYVERATRDLHLVDVMWGNSRGQLYPAGCVFQEYIDELETVDD